MSSLYKAKHYIELKGIKKMHISASVQEKEQVPSKNVKLSKSEEEQLKELKKQMIADAEEAAKRQFEESLSEIEAIRKTAEDEISQWWIDKRREDVQIVEQARQAGYEEGLLLGKEEARTEIEATCADQLAQSARLLHDAHEKKTEIIAEAEPFLVELGIHIAEKIMNKQLALEPAWIIEQAKSVLKRKFDQGTITLCVAPENYAKMEAARDELQQSVPSQTELKIIPDFTVKDHGCMVRSSFGMIDATITTQLAEIKAVLQEISLRKEEPYHDEAYTEIG